MPKAKVEKIAKKIEKTESELLMELQEATTKALIKQKKYEVETTFTSTIGPRSFGEVKAGSTVKLNENEYNILKAYIKG